MSSRRLREVSRRQDVPRFRAARFRLREEGYTLLEIILVIAIIGLLSSMAIGRYIDILIEVKFKRAIFDLRSLENAITLYSVSHGLPETLSDLDIMSTVDPWGSPYRYQERGAGRCARTVFWCL